VKCENVRWVAGKLLYNGSAVKGRHEKE